MSSQDTGVRRDRVHIGALELDRATVSEVRELFARAVADRTLHQVVTVNLQFLGFGLKNPGFARVVNGASLVVADGVPAIWLSKLQGKPIPERITGHELFDLCALIAQERGYSVFLLGGGLGAAEEAARRLQAQYPRLKIAGMHQGHFTPEGIGVTEEEERKAVAAVAAARPDFLFAGLGCGKQEFWIHNHLQTVQVPVCIGVGGVIDVLAGRAGRAPRWMQRVGLEWFYRLVQEPRRLWRRYLLQDIPTGLRLAVAALVRRGFAIVRRQGKRRAPKAVARE